MNQRWKLLSACRQPRPPCEEYWQSEAVFNGKPAPEAQLKCFLHGGRMETPISLDEQ